VVVEWGILCREDGGEGDSGLPARILFRFGSEKNLLEDDSDILDL